MKNLVANWLEQYVKQNKFSLVLVGLFTVGCYLFVFFSGGPIFHPVVLGIVALFDLYFLVFGSVVKGIF